KLGRIFTERFWVIIVRIAGDRQELDPFGSELLLEFLDVQVLLLAIAWAAREEEADDVQLAIQVLGLDLFAAPFREFPLLEPILGSVWRLVGLGPGGRSTVSSTSGEGFRITRTDPDQRSAAHEHQHGQPEQHGPTHNISPDVLRPLTRHAPVN